MYRKFVKILKNPEKTYYHFTTKPKTIP